LIAEFKERVQNRHVRGRELKGQGKKCIACFYGLVPKELVHAAGMVPIQLLEDRNPHYDERSQLLPYLCGMSKNVTGQIYEGVFDYVDGVLVATVCDTNRHVFDIWVHRNALPNMMLVRAPSTDSDMAVKYYTGEMKRLARELEKISGKKVTEDGLRQSIALFNENRDLFGQLYERRPASGVTAQDAVHIFGAALVTPVEEHNEMMKRLLASLPAPGAPSDAKKLMLCGVNLNMAADIIKMAEKWGGTVVTDDFTNNSRYGSHNIEVDGDPFAALAKGYLRKVPAPGIYPFEERANDIRARMKKADGEGMIYLIQLYCDAYAMEYAVLKERFDAWKLNHLKLEAEDTPSSIEQLNVRVQSYIESLL